MSHSYAWTIEDEQETPWIQTANYTEVVQSAAHPRKIEDLGGFSLLVDERKERRAHVAKYPVKLLHTFALGLALIVAGILLFALEFALAATWLGLLASAIVTVGLLIVAFTLFKGQAISGVV